MKITLKIAEDGKWIGLMVAKALSGSANRGGFVLTAAHCILKNQQLFVRLGVYDKYCPPSRCPEVENYNVTKGIPHQQYNHFERTNDIGILKLDRQVVYKNAIRPLCIVLSDEYNPSSIVNFSVYGWGITDKGSPSSVLQTINLSRRRLCFGSTLKRESQICAGAPKGDTCRGDSGGPLVANITYQGYRFLSQIGIVSFGGPECNSNAIYTNINSYKHWINYTILDNDYDQDQESLLDENCSNTRLKHGSIRQPWKVKIIPSFANGALITNHILAPICFRPNLQKLENPPTSLTAIIRSWENVMLKYENLTVIDRYRCSNIIGYPVFDNQICLNESSSNLFSDGEVFGTNEYTSLGDKFFLYGIMSYKRNGVVILTNIKYYAEWIRSICIVTGDGLNTSSIVNFSAYGWGKTEKQNLSSILQTINLSQKKTCLKFNGESQICAGAERGDTCEGDSGGPLVANITYLGYVFPSQIGITSFGSIHCNASGIYTNVTVFRQWIKRTILANDYDQDQERLLDENCSNTRRKHGSIHQPWKVNIRPSYAYGALLTKRFVVTIASYLPTNVQNM
uniref:Uncharacterized protein LOC108044960 n=1 Tax=Drosophila rhopaloa TaxID=1041015 RepID=A0A6P4EN29_DRORH